MAKKILQINVDYSVPTEEFKASWMKAAEPISQQPGLIWKVWIYDDATHHGGGIYLFESLEDVDAYLESDMVKAFKASPVISNLSVKVFDIGEEPSAVTRAPLGELTSA